MSVASSSSLRLFSRSWRGLALLIIAWAGARAQVAEVPFLTGRITDNAEILSPQARERLTGIIRTHEQSTSNEIAILTLPSFESGSIDEFAAQVLKSWKLGQKGRENGVLVVVSPGDRRVRIEVGGGLRDSLSEGAAARIVRDLMAPRFNEGDYEKGLEDGIEAIVGQLGTGPAGQETTSEQGQTAKASSFESPDLSIPERILIGSFVFGIIGLFTVIGVITPGAGWFLYLFLIPFWAMFPIIVVGVRGALVLLITYLIGFPAAKLFLTRSEWYARAKEQLMTKGVAHIGGFTVKSAGTSEISWSSSGQAQSR